MKKLFICNMGMHRSKTAAEIFKGKYAGIYSNRNPVTKELLEEADIIYVMEPHQRKHIADNFPKQYLLKKIICLDIPDIYNYKDPKLIKILKEKIKTKKTPPKKYEAKEFLKNYFEIAFILLKLELMNENKSTIESLSEFNKWLIPKHANHENILTLESIEEMKALFDKDREELEQKQQLDKNKRIRLRELEKAFEEIMRKLK